MMTFHPDQAGPNCNHSYMDCIAYVQLPMDVYRIYDTIYTQIIKPPHYLLVHLSDLDYGRNPDIGTLKKERRGHIFRVLHRYLQSKTPAICKCGAIWNGKNIPKGYIYRRNNSHKDEKWGLCMP